ncbi:hypothetical protein COB72_08995 [bacterium]|nr:MAG: hypothetical protein COB72_08995 [bacterium]
MSHEEQSNAFNEVRAILGKLDRSIDEARSRRLEPDQPINREPMNKNGVNGTNGTQSAASLDREIGASPSANNSKTELQKKSATFGRAKPLNGSPAPAPSQWKSTNAGDDQMIG